MQWNNVRENGEVKEHKEVRSGFRQLGRIFSKFRNRYLKSEIVFEESHK